MQKGILWVVFILIIIFVVAGVVRMAKQENGGVASYDIRITEVDQAVGPAVAPLTLVEYSDFQCPACASYHSIVKELLAEHGESLRFVYRHYPLPQHRNARPAAYMAEAAGRQGKFFEMHDLIFQNQISWTNMSDEQASAEFIGYAQTLGLDLNKIATDLQDQAIINKVDADLASGNRFGVNATPTFYLNGRKLQNPPGMEAFRAILRAELPADSSATTTTDVTAL
ncbi:MAG: disulfide bond formation protein DsbA [Candidatus Vogelbacteria bacterium CG10_big_fil_rev_8_21_14_0_10_51_16]|uniref:Disulfide bond formation protein DsbA n=1 Tax=Candidatus Vogelbacteria bacterium CG10_big_fil_rev_8_21_14_0_10_51_16 TaxID=1975045 RepID=A0A2H0RFR6_9BACT|nr:MAG: disulfide bond formation protein DsbA [Candidatus Vogelbacteria bacterium CG10_big_fil_rev_8_21_14_0_10_51_16]